MNGSGDICLIDFSAYSIQDTLPVSCSAFQKNKLKRRWKRINQSIWLLFVNAKMPTSFSCPRFQRHPLKLSPYLEISVFWNQSGDDVSVACWSGTNGVYTLPVLRADWALCSKLVYACMPFSIFIQFHLTYLFLWVEYHIDHLRWDCLYLSWCYACNGFLVCI